MLNQFKKKNQIILFNKPGSAEADAVSVNLFDIWQDGVPDIVY